MSFLDDIINTTKSAAATAGKKTDEAVKFTKLKIKESQTTGDIKSHFEKLGEMAYEILVNGKKPGDMEIEYADSLTKQYMASRCQKLGITVPDTYVAISEE